MILLIQWHFAKRNIFTGKVAWNSYLTNGLRHNCVIDQSATENKVIHTLIIDFFSHGLRSVKIEQELENVLFFGAYTNIIGLFFSPQYNIYVLHVANFPLCRAVLVCLGISDHFVFHQQLFVSYLPCLVLCPTS